MENWIFEENAQKNSQGFSAHTHMGQQARKMFNFVSKITKKLTKLLNFYFKVGQIWWEIEYLKKMPKKISQGFSAHTHMRQQAKKCGIL